VSIQTNDLLTERDPSHATILLGYFFFGVPFSIFGFPAITAGRCNSLKLSNLKCVAEISYKLTVI
jgi:hypothetical protein